jgi:hypothetical protein
MGTIGAATGACLGRLSTPVLGAVAGARLGTALGVSPLLSGTLGAVAATVVEFKDRELRGHLPLGRLVGGIVGGTVGAGVGKLLDLVGQPPVSKTLDTETRGFSLGKLPERLWNTRHTAHQVLQPELIQDMIEIMKPGDLVLVSNENQLDLQIPQLLTGHSADWVHAALYVGEGELVDAAIGRGVTTRQAAEMLGDSHHARVLRPHYEEGQAEKTVDYARSQIGKGFDFLFNLSDDSGFGCLELSWRSLKEGAPQIEMEPHRLLGKEYLTPSVFNGSPKFDLIKDTGSNFGINYLSKFC